MRTGANEVSLFDLKQRNQTAQDTPKGRQMLVFALAAVLIWVLGFAGEPAAHASAWYMPKPVVQFYEGFMAKLGHLRKLDEENRHLRWQLAKSRIEDAKLARVALYWREKARADAIKSEAVSEGGLPASRTIASLEIVHANLGSRSPAKVFSEASSAFADEDFQTAARDFIFLAKNPHAIAFQTPQTFYLAGVSLYKIGNMKQAESYLREAVQNAAGASVSYAPRALSWIALCKLRLGDQAGSRRVIHELIEKYPRSREAHRLNRRGGNAG